VTSRPPRSKGRLAALAVWTTLVIAYIATTFPGFNMLHWLGIGLATGLFFQPSIDKSTILVAVRDWIGVLIFLFLYILSRKIADTAGMPWQEASMIWIDEILGFGEIPTHRLQEWIDWSASPAWWELTFPIIYTSHFLVPFAIMATLYATNRPRAQAYMSRFVLVSAMGLVGYILLPTVPPWMSSDRGAIDLVQAGFDRDWETLGLPWLTSAFGAGRDLANPVAAMPSLHCAYPALAYFFFAPGRGPARHVLLGFYALYMGFTVVITGQHWLIDVFAGWLVAWAGHRIMTRHEAKREAEPTVDREAAALPV